MVQSAYRETKWSDILETAVFGPPFFLLFLPEACAEPIFDAIEKFSEREAKPSRLSFLSRPLQVVAREIAAASRSVVDGKHAVPAMLWTSGVPALAAGGKAALALGFSWSALTAGGHVAAMAGAALGGVGVAVAAYPVALFALATGLIVTLGVGRSALHAGDVVRVLRAGIRETRWKKDPAPAPDISMAPAAPVAAPPSPALSAFNSLSRKMELEDEAERTRFIATLRRKYPAEFADALRLEQHTPELRTDITVKKPLQLKIAKKPKPRGIARYMPGRSP